MLGVLRAQHAGVHGVEQLLADTALRKAIGFVLDALRHRGIEHAVA